MDLRNLKGLYPNYVQGIFSELTVQLEKQTWSNENKIMFLAQCAHESAGFRVLKENLNYRADALLRVFPKYFKNKDVSKYSRNPEKIANLVYANRMGNGSELSGDGYKFRGRGLIQLTGRNNYTKMGYQNNPEYLETAKGAVESAIWFWNTNNLYKQTDFSVITKIINGGLNGLDDRKKHLSNIKSVLS